MLCFSHFPLRKHVLTWTRVSGALSMQWPAWSSHLLPHVIAPESLRKPFGSLGQG